MKPETKSTKPEATKHWDIKQDKSKDQSKDKKPGSDVHHQTSGTNIPNQSGKTSTSTTQQSGHSGIGINKPLDKSGGLDNMNKQKHGDFTHKGNKNK